MSVRGAARGGSVGFGSHTEGLHPQRVFVRAGRRGGCAPWCGAQPVGRGQGCRGTRGSAQAAVKLHVRVPGRRFDGTSPRRVRRGSMSLDPAATRGNFTVPGPANVHLTRLEHRQTGTSPLWPPQAQVGSVSNRGRPQHRDTGTSPRQRSRPPPRRHPPFAARDAGAAPGARPGPTAAGRYRPPGIPTETPMCHTSRLASLRVGCSVMLPSGWSSMSPSRRYSTSPFSR